MINIKQATTNILNGCVIKSNDGTNFFTPDGMGNYRAIWTRDFSYMVEYAGDLFTDDDMKDCIEYLMVGVRDDGWIPDRVDENRVPFYTAGGDDFPANPNLDNGQFLVILADCYLTRLEEADAKEQFIKWKDILCRGIDCLPKDEYGFIYNDPSAPHSPYGFTDCICKTGSLAMESILLWRALKILVKWLGKCNEQSKKYQETITSIEHNLSHIFSDKSGMLFAATNHCHQIDIWASCYAISVGFPFSATQKSNIAKYLIANYDAIVQHGQIRHLPEKLFWEKTLIPVEHGTYQNGAFWATATGWFYDAIVDYDEKLAKNLIEDILIYFEKYGIYECVNEDYKKLDTYVVSATNVYYVCK